MEEPNPSQIVSSMIMQQQSLADVVTMLYLYRDLLIAAPDDVLRTIFGKLQLLASFNTGVELVVVSADQVVVVTDPDLINTNYPIQKLRKGFEDGATFAVRAREDIEV